MNKLDEAITVHANDQGRVIARYPDGCETAFPVWRWVSLADIVQQHDKLHAEHAAGRKS